MDHTERDATDNCSDVPSTRETLGGHLYQKVSELCEGRGASPDLLEKLTGMLMECGTTDMLLLLRDKQHLQVRLAAAIQTLSSADNIDEKGFAFYNDSDNIHNLGVQLFAKVSEIESGLCAQITGMLLELDPKGVELLLKDEEKLRRAVEKSKSTFLEHHNYTNGVSGQPSSGDDIYTSGERTIPETDHDMLDIGERLHETVTAVYPESAAQITGMLLEMNPKMLKLLMQDEGLLWKKIEIAREVLNQQEKT